MRHHAHRLCSSPASHTAGAILSISFKTKYSNLPRIQIECDLLDTEKTYRHVFNEQGCAAMDYVANVPFTDQGGNTGACGRGTGGGIASFGRTEMGGAGC